MVDDAVEGQGWLEAPCVDDLVHGGQDGTEQADLFGLLLHERDQLVGLRADEVELGHLSNKVFAVEDRAFHLIEAWQVDQ